MNKTEKRIKEGFLGQKMIVLPPNIKRNILKNSLINSFYVTAVGFYPNAAFHNRERRSGCEEYIFLYCTAGSGSVFLKGESFKLIPNQFIIIPKNTAHGYKSSIEDPWTIYWMHFTGNHAENIYERYLEFNLDAVFTAYEQHRIEKFDQIFKLMENNFEERNLELTNIKLQEFLSNFIYTEEINPSSSGSDKISDSISFMKEHIQYQFSVYELAQQQNLSATHYSRMFRAKTGNSPNHYFNELKIQKACQHLYFSNQSIKEICADLGFQDPYYFSRLFKKLMGISPVNYKSKRKKN